MHIVRMCAVWQYGYQMLMLSEDELCAELERDRALRASAKGRLRQNC